MALLKKRTSGVATTTLQKHGTGPTTPLMLVHVTAVGAAREILRQGQLNTVKCKVMGRNLLYFFVLRPAYKLKGAEDKRSLIDFFPSVFVIAPENLGAPYHVYPFDTGGALHGAFDDGASPYFYLEDYELEPTLQAASNHIDWAFGSFEKYFDGILRPDFASPFAPYEVGPISFAKIAALASQGSNSPDRRASAIEIAYEHHVSISEVKLAVLPKQFLEDPKGDNKEMLNALSAAGVQWQTYEWMPNRTPAYFQSEINQIVRDYLKSGGHI